MLFSQLIGNESIKTELRRMVETHAVPGVLLFHGPSGVGKRLFAEEFALHLLSSSGPADKHPDLHHVFPDKNGMHSIASVREFIAETTLPPFTAKGKVFIVHDADKMLPTSSNALLKTLEEPPPATWIILLATDVGAMLPTVLSRCRQLAFRSSHLPPKRNDPVATILLEILQAGLESASSSPLMQRLEEALKDGEEEHIGGNELLSVLLYWMRDLALLQAGGPLESLYFNEYRAVLESQARQLKQLPFQKVFSLIERAEARLVCNMRPFAVLEECFLQFQQYF